MLKDNHVWSTGSIGDAVRAGRAVGGFSLKLEVECRDYDEAIQAAEAGADVIMLDNMVVSGVPSATATAVGDINNSNNNKTDTKDKTAPPQPPANDLHATAARLKARYPRVLIEASGGLRPDHTLANYMSPHIDVLSLGALTQGVPHIDFSLKIDRNNH